MFSAGITAEEIKAKMEELLKMQSALEAKIQALSAGSASSSPAETKRQRDDSASVSTSSSSSSESADSAESKRARTGDVVPPPAKQGSAAGKASDGRLTKEEMEKELDAYRHEDGFTFRIMRPPRVVLCKEKGEKWRGLEKIERVDLCCTARNYDPPCPARRTVDRDPATGRIIEVRAIGEHIDHGRKRASRADSDVRRRAKQLVQDNARPADAEQVLVAEAEKETPPGMPIVAHRTMSQRQVSQLRQYENHKLNPYPAHQMLANISARFGTNLLLSNYDPVRFVYMSQWQRAYAGEKKAKVLLIDTTFDCVEEYKLTTLLVRHFKHKQVYFPLAFFIHSSSTARDYERFLQEVQREAGLTPAVVLRDFAFELRNAINSVWPTAANVGDLFHFLHDNRKWLTSNNISEKEAILRELREIALQRDNERFWKQYREWQARYRSCGDYMAYFLRIWDPRREEWSMGCREKDAPSGDQAIEGYQWRIQKTVLNGVAKMDLLRVIACLDKEVQHWERIIRSPELVERLQKDKERKMAARVLTVPEQAQVEDELEALIAEAAVASKSSMTLRSTVEASQETQVQAYATEPSAAGSQASTTPAAAAQTLAAARAPRAAHASSDELEVEEVREDDEDVLDKADAALAPSILRQQARCPKCKAARVMNKKCSHRVCASCCEKLFGDCSIKAHNLRRLKAALAPVIADLTKAMSLDESVSVWLKYATPSALAPRWYEAHAIKPNPECPKQSIVMKHNSVTQGREVEMTFKLARLHAISFTNPE